MVTEPTLPDIWVDQYLRLSKILITTPWYRFLKRKELKEQRDWIYPLIKNDIRIKTPFS